MDFKKTLQHSVLRRHEPRSYQWVCKIRNIAASCIMAPLRTFMDANCANPTSVSNTAHFHRKELDNGGLEGFRRVVDSPLLLPCTPPLLCQSPCLLIVII